MADISNDSNDSNGEIDPLDDPNSEVNKIIEYCIDVFTGNTKSAIKRTTYEIMRRPNDAAVYFYRAILFGVIDDLDMAIADYTDAIRFKPNSTYYRGRGDMYSRKGDTDSAIADYMEALRLDPDCEDAQKALAKLSAAGIPVDSHAKIVKKEELDEVTAKMVAGMERNFVLVNGGTFRMGNTAEQDDDCEKDEESFNTVTLCDFYICKYLVTQNLWVRVMGYNPSMFKGDDLPVENVSWYDVQKFIERLNSITGKRYRLPKDAEWEYAARGGSKSNGYEYSGSNNVDDAAWYNVNSGDKVLNECIFEEYLEKDDMDGYIKLLCTNQNRPRPVGTKQPNELGIYDMSGNVWEFVSNCLGDCSSKSHADPTNSTMLSKRMVRGGSCCVVAASCQVFIRNYGDHDCHNIDLGFRLACSPQ